MKDASQADIRIIDADQTGYVIHCGPDIEVPTFKEELEILTGDQRFLVNDTQLEGLEDNYTVATDF